MLQHLVIVSNLNKNVFERAKAKTPYRIELLEVRLGLPDWKYLPVHNTFNSPTRHQNCCTLVVHSPSETLVIP